MKTNPNYRVEHIAPVPRGWRVRTKTAGTHLLRIAFPPGARRRGSGKRVEILHPLNENPCAMQATKQRRGPRFLKNLKISLVWTVQATRKGGTFGNSIIQQFATEKEARAFAKTIDRAYYMKPEIYQESTARQNPDTTGPAAALYEQFHGQSPKEILEIQESDAARQTYTGLGALKQLVIDAPAGKVTITFDPQNDGVKVASAPGGKQIYLLGGNQNIDSQLGSFGSDPTKDFVELGAAVKITYRARKSIDNFQLVDYWHKLGEETNEPPFAFYDRIKHRIFLAGGRYRVEAPGIIN